MKPRFFLVFIALAFFLTLWFGCSNDNSPTEAVEEEQLEKSLCERFTIDNSGQPAVKVDCNSFNVKVSNIGYDSRGRVIAFDYDIRCTNSSEHYAGRIFNIKHLGLSNAITAFDGTINGEECHYSKQP